jgi:hypothetical protein
MDDVVLLKTPRRRGSSYQRLIQSSFLGRALFGLLLLHGLALHRLLHRWMRKGGFLRNSAFGLGLQRESVLNLAPNLRRSCRKLSCPFSEELSQVLSCYPSGDEPLLIFLVHEVGLLFSSGSILLCCCWTGCCRTGCCSIGMWISVPISNCSLLNADRTRLNAASPSE